MFERFDSEGLRTLAVHGEIDLAFEEAFQDEMTDLLEQAHSPVIVDLAAVTFMDSSGLRVLVSGKERGRGLGIDVVLRAPSPRVLRVLQIAGIDQAFEIQDGS